MDSPILTIFDMSISSKRDVWVVFGRGFHEKIPCFKIAMSGRAGGRLASGVRRPRFTFFQSDMLLFSSEDCFHIRTVASLEGFVTCTIH